MTPFFQIVVDRRRPFIRSAPQGTASRKDSAMSPADRIGNPKPQSDFLPQ
jgi:hypothetical protein